MRFLALMVATYFCANWACCTSAASVWLSAEAEDIQEASMADAFGALATAVLGAGADTSVRSWKYSNNTSNAAIRSPTDTAAPSNTVRQHSHSFLCGCTEFSNDNRLAVDDVRA
jgi:hypothetical protein